MGIRILVPAPIPIPLNPAPFTIIPRSEAPPLRAGPSCMSGSSEGLGVAEGNGILFLPSAPNSTHRPTLSLQAFAISPLFQAVV